MILVIILFFMYDIYKISKILHHTWEMRCVHTVTNYIYSELGVIDGILLCKNA